MKIVTGMISDTSLTNSHLPLGASSRVIPFVSSRMRGSIALTTFGEKAPSRILR